MDLLGIIAPGFCVLLLTPLAERRQNSTYTGSLCLDPGLVFFSFIVYSFHTLHRLCFLISTGISTVDILYYFTGKLLPSDALNLLYSGYLHITIHTSQNLYYVFFVNTWSLLLYATLTCTMEKVFFFVQIGSHEFSFEFLHGDVLEPGG